MLFAGGTAADAAIAAQAVLCVVMPDACGVGGDMVALVHSPRCGLFALNGIGTVPGTVDAWCELSRREGRLPLARCLQPAIHLAELGIRVSQTLATALVTQRPRLQRGGAGSWSLFGQRFGARVKQPQLAFLLQRIGIEGRSFFYGWPAARAMERQAQSLGGTLSEADLAAHETVVSNPIATTWGAITIVTPPPMSLAALLGDLTQEKLLERVLEVDPQRAPLCIQQASLLPMRKGASFRRW